jgi:CDP-glycerol glycerophosphotransferase (TagB/SpsB family)
MSLKNSNDTIGNRTRDLPICSVVPSPLRQRAPLYSQNKAFNSDKSENLWMGKQILFQSKEYKEKYRTLHGMFVCQNLVTKYSSTFLSKENLCNVLRVVKNWGKSVFHVLSLLCNTVFLRPELLLFVCLFSWRYNPLWFYFHSPVAGISLLVSRFLDHTQRRATVGRTPLDDWSVRRRDLNLTTHNIHNTQISIPPVGFEPTISAGERPKTYALDRAATGTGALIV